MKRLLITFAIVLCAAGLYGQNTFKYEVRVTGGLTVGTNGTKLDSMKVMGSRYYVYSGVYTFNPILPSDTSSMLTNYALTSEVRQIVSDNLTAAISGAEVGLALADSNVYDKGYATPTFVDTQIAAAGGGADSSIYVTVTRLTDSLNVMRSLINDLIAAVELIGVDITAPTIDSLEIGNFDDDVIQVWWSEPMITHGDSIPAATVWGLTEDGNAFGITGYSFVNDSVMRIGLDSVAQYGSTYLLSYTRVAPFLTDKALNPVANFTNRSVDNNVADIAPILLSAELGTYNDTIIVALFSKALDETSTPAASDFTFEAGVDAIGINAITINVDTVFIALDSLLTVYDDSTLLLSYTSGANPLRSTTLTEVANFADSTITNNLAVISYEYDMLLTSKGDGSGVAAFRVTVSTNTTFTLDGAARFYSNSAGDADESTTWEATSGGDRIRYIRLATGTANMNIPDVRNVTKFGSEAGGWNDGGANGVYPALSITNFVNLTWLYFSYFATDAVLSGSITNLTNLTSIYVNVDNTLQGNISNHDNFTAAFTMTGGSVGGNLGTSSVGTGSSTNINNTGTFTYTAGKNWKNAEHTITMTSLARADVINMWLDMDASSPSITSKTLMLYSTPTLSDTNQGGIWGDFSGTPTPSALAIAIKSLAVTKGNTLTLSHAGIVSLPGGTGDGSGFPAGFGDWYRSADPEK